MNIQCCGYLYDEYNVCCRGDDQDLLHGVQFDGTGQPMDLKILVNGDRLFDGHRFICCEA